ncbi:MAG: TetR family transcriptional regulator C-terminal domain-containing protein [Actinomycetota bacterium]
MPRTTDTRKRMVRSAAGLFRRQGYAATGWRQVVADSETPWGSQSHHFPGGKEELAVEAIARSGAGYERLLASAFASGPPGAAVRLWAETAAAELEASGWSDGCPIATIVLEQAHRSDPIATACAEVLRSWQVVAADALAVRGVEPDDATRLGTTLVSAIEGALVLARAGREPAPLLAVGETLAELLDRAVTGAGSGSGAAP